MAACQNNLGCNHVIWRQITELPKAQKSCYLKNNHEIRQDMARVVVGSVCAIVDVPKVPTNSKKLLITTALKSENLFDYLLNYLHKIKHKS